jgi:hypothetical protein
MGVGGAGTISAGQLGADRASGSLPARVFDSGNIGNVAGIHTSVSPGDLLSSGLFTAGGQLSSGELRGLLVGDNADNGLSEISPDQLAQINAASGIPSSALGLPSWALIGLALLLLFFLFD